MAQALLTREKQNPSNLSGSRASYIREIVPGERRIEIRQRLEGEDASPHLFAIRVLEDEARYEVKLSGETSKSEKQDLDLNGPAA